MEPDTTSCYAKYRNGHGDISHNKSYTNSLSFNQKLVKIKLCFFCLSLREAQAARRRTSDETISLKIDEL